MSGPHTIEPSGRSAPCSAACNHPICVKLAANIRREKVAALVWTIAEGSDEESDKALQELATLAKGGRDADW